MRYIIYLRVSTEKQEDSGLGLDAQRFACTEWIKKQSTIGETVEYIDVVTGTDKNRKELEERPKLLEALNDLEKGDIVIILKRERLSRDTFIIGMIERMIEKKGCKLLCANGEMDGNAPHDILMRRIIDAFAEYEALMISTRTKAALARKKAKGERLGHIPYGFILDENKNLRVNFEESKALEVMHGYRMNNRWSYRAIAEALNSLGYRNRGGTLWTHGATSRVYSNWPQVEVLASRASFLQEQA